MPFSETLYSDVGGAVVAGVEVETVDEDDESVQVDASKSENTS